MNLYIDCRALQDTDYAHKGIGQHGTYIITLLHQMKGIRLIPLCDPTLADPRADVLPLFHTGPQWIADISAGVYLNLSPLTHDTSASVVAKSRGVKCMAVVHDFIAFRPESAGGSAKVAIEYEYRKNILHDYDVLLANSDFTRQEIAAYLPGYLGQTITIHCHSRFPLPIHRDGEASPLRKSITDLLDSAKPYVLWAGADDPRKNLDLVIRSTVELARAGYRLIIGGGISETTKRRMSEAHPDQHVIGDPTYLPRLSDAELEHTYRNASVVIVTSEDEGFSLPVSEAIALGIPVIASRIPAHQEQILDDALLFDTRTVSAVISSISASAASARNSRATPYRKIDHAAEATQLQTLIGRLTALRTPAHSREIHKAIIVGPGFGNKSGIAVYNRLLCAELDRLKFAYEYVDLETLTPAALYAWIYENRSAHVLYVMGNNNVFHSNCFIAMRNLPGDCILHDSRLFEFLLNRYGPYYIVDLWKKRNLEPIGIDVVAEWQQDRRLLPAAFLEPLLSRIFRVMVHSKVAAEHIRQYYQFSQTHYLPFALQMTSDEVDLVLSARKRRGNISQGRRKIVMLGETEPTKCCSHMIFAMKLLVLQGVDAELHFVGKADEPYFSELKSHVKGLNLTDRVSFTSYVPREEYVQSLVAADVVVQLRYPLFGQVSGPLADAVACGVPAVTTLELAAGTEIEQFCNVIPNDFSPLHIAEAVRTVLSNESAPSAGRVGTMGDYARRVTRLLNGAMASSQA